MMNTTATKKEHIANFHIAGNTYYDTVLAFEQLKIGSKLTLKPEPENPYDPRAVAIYYNDHKLGFVPRGENRVLFKFLTMGYNVFETHIQTIDPQAHPEEQIRVIVHLPQNI